MQSKRTCFFFLAPKQTNDPNYIGLISYTCVCVCAVYSALTVNDPRGDCVKRTEAPGVKFSTLKTVRNWLMALASASVYVPRVLIIAMQFSTPFSEYCFPVSGDIIVTRVNFSNGPKPCNIYVIINTHSPLYGMQDNHQAKYSYYSPVTMSLKNSTESVNSSAVLPFHLATSHGTALSSTYIPIAVNFTNFPAISSPLTPASR